MEGDSRRNRLLQLLGQEAQPISGTELSKRLGVSRQVIVQDIALLRAVNKDILSTNKGYLLYQKEEAGKKVRRSMKVCHTNDQIRDELYTIVDYGGKVSDVVVEHEIYGQIMVDLIINSRADVDAFCEKVQSRQIKPLNELTSGVHFHTVQAEDEETLDAVEQALRQKGYLI